MWDQRWCFDDASKSSGEQAVIISCGAPDSFDVYGACFETLTKLGFAMPGIANKELLLRLLEDVHEVYDVLLSCVETYEWVQPGATGLLRLWMLQWDVWSFLVNSFDSTVRLLSMPREVVVVEYDDLVAGADLGSQLLEAWGPGSLGVVAVRGVPRWEEREAVKGVSQSSRALEREELYMSVLKLSHKLAHLSPESLRAIEDEASMYNAGWSHGKEKLGDKPDLAKGSFYFNPLADAPGTEEDRAKFPWALPKNLWPKDMDLRHDSLRKCRQLGRLQEIPELETHCKALGRVMQEVIGQLGKQVDRVMAGKVQSYTANLGKTLSETQKCKGRLLYYFPPKETGAAQEAVPEDWLRLGEADVIALLSEGEIIPNPDPEGAGLWVVDRDGSAIRVRIPPDCMAIQVGECTQVVTAGEFVATPHCVRGCRPEYANGRKAACGDFTGFPDVNLPKAARISCPCFVDTHPSFELRIPEGVSREEVLARGLSSKVPPLGERWEPGQNFGDFLGSTFRRYYDWALKSSSPPEKRAKTS
eukprot:s1999_g4.t1